jgi:hypothetical protein
VHEASGPEFDRRTLYRMNVNSARSPLLESLDCPDPSVKTPRRAATTTPLQALALMNSWSVLSKASALSARVQPWTPGDVPAQVTAAFRLALGRKPTMPEQAQATKLANDRGLEYVCWALFNSSEFLYLR